MPVQRSRWSGPLRCPGAPGFAGIFGEAHPAVFIGQVALYLMSGKVAFDPFILIESNDPGIFPHHAFVEDAAGEDIELLLLQGLQMAVADFGDAGDGFQRDAAELPFLP